MKKILAMILVLSFTITTFAACGNSEADSLVSASQSEAVGTTEDTKVTPQDFSTPIAFDQINDFEDFADELEKSKIKFEKIETDDGGIIIDMKLPSSDSDDRESVKPAIPTVDKVTKPISPEKDELEAEDKKDDADTAPDDADQTADSDDTPKPSIPEVTPEPIPEPEPEPTPDPKPTRPVYTYTTGQKHTAITMGERYLYSILDEERKGYYRTIDKAVRGLEEKSFFNIAMSENSNYIIYFLYMFDNPELWYLGNTVTIMGHEYGTSDLSYSYTDGENYCSYGHNPNVITEELKASILEKDAVFKAEVQRIVSTIPTDAPDVVKERLIYDRILIDSYYDLSARWKGIGPDDWTAYGILVDKNGVCESYSEAFQTLLSAVGIVSTGVVGDAGGGHKWNAVRLDGEWYMCDITFDDPIGGDPNDAYHYYFNLTTARMEELGHEITEDRWQIPTCNGTKYSYENYFG